MNIPIFPLQLIVFPGESLNLHIFEQKYRQLFADLKSGTITFFGIPPVVDHQMHAFGTRLILTDIVKNYPGGEMDVSTQGIDVFKLGGILIENSFKSNGEIISIVGIGLNINQSNFHDLPQAASIYTRIKHRYEVDFVRDELLKHIRISIAKVINKQVDNLWQLYHEYLFKKDVPITFENTNGNRFMGIIQQVNQNGQLEVLLEDDKVQCFDVKEVKMLY